MSIQNGANTSYVHKKKQKNPCPQYATAHMSFGENWLDFLATFGTKITTKNKNSARNSCAVHKQVLNDEDEDDDENPKQQRLGRCGGFVCGSSRKHGWHGHR